MMDVTMFTQRVFVQPYYLFENVMYPKMLIAIAPAYITNVKNIK